MRISWEYRATLHYEFSLDVSVVIIALTFFSVYGLDVVFIVVITVNESKIIVDHSNLCLI